MAPWFGNQLCCSCTMVELLSRSAIHKWLSRKSYSLSGSFWEALTVGVGETTRISVPWDSVAFGNLFRVVLCRFGLRYPAVCLPACLPTSARQISKWPSFVFFESPPLNPGIMRTVLNHQMSFMWDGLVYSIIRPSSSNRLTRRYAQLNGLEPFLEVVACMTPRWEKWRPFWNRPPNWLQSPAWN